MKKTILSFSLLWFILLTFGPAFPQGVATVSIIDAQRLSLTPSRAPKILDEDGRELYGSAYMDKGWAEKQGVSRPNNGDLITSNFANASFAPSLAGKPEQKSPEEKEGTDQVELNKGYLEGYFADTKYILTSPSRWEKSDWLKASVVAGVTIGLYAYDQDIRDWAQKTRNNTTDNVARFTMPFGNGLVTLLTPTLGAFYLYGYSLEDKKARTTALLGLESFLISGVFTGTIKFTTHRYRPSEGNQYDKWGGPSFSTSYQSFPSWQSSSAFAIGTTIASKYHDNAWIPPCAYGIATLTALSRIHDNDHWASDVFFGSAVGFFTAKAIVVLHKEKEDVVAIYPVIDAQVRALAISYRF